jgi:glutathione peroxidase
MRVRNVIALILINILVISNLNAQNKSFYDFSVRTIDGEIFDFSNLKGKKVLIVNTASECGNTPQYKDLEELYKLYGGEKFIIIGFPANNFGSQEPGTDKQIKEFCDVNYSITFPMMSKISVKGEDISPLYKWLTTKEENGVMDSSVRWNFQKYLIDENGILVSVVAPKENPLSDKIVDWIKGSNLMN